MSPAEWLAQFEQMVSQDESAIDLAHAALIIATDEYPDLDLAHYLAQLDGMARAARAYLDRDASAREQIAQLNRFLFEDLNFRGNRIEYYDPRNSYLNNVLERRVGLPITLGLVYIEVAKRLELPIYGVGLPGHFVVKWSDAGNEIFIDPFDEGKILDAAGLRRLVQETLPQDVPLDPEWLVAVGPKYILTRMLNNLRGIFIHLQEHTRALAAMEKILLLEPNSAQNLRDVGVLAYRAQHYRRAATYFEKFLASHSASSDVDQIRQLLDSALTEAARLN